MPQLDDMALFAAVVRAGSFTAAARQLELPLSTVSRRIVLLEKALDTRLMERTTRSQKLTEAGQVYFQHCQQLVAQAEEAGRALQRLKQEPSAWPCRSRWMTAGRPRSFPPSWPNIPRSRWKRTCARAALTPMTKPWTYCSPMARVRKPTIR